MKVRIYLLLLASAGFVCSPASFSADKPLQHKLNTSPDANKPLQHKLNSKGSRKLPAIQKSRAEAIRKKILVEMSAGKKIKIQMRQLGGLLRSMQRLQKQKRKSKHALRVKARKARAMIARIQRLNGQLKKGFTLAESRGIRKGGSTATERLRRALGNMVKDLEAQDKLGNFEIQRLMSQYNQSEQLASSVQKKSDDTSAAVIGKVG